MAGLRRSLYRIYWRLEQWIVPGLRSSQYAYWEQLAEVLDGREADPPPTGGPAWLDLGCGHRVFAEWMTQEQDQLIGKSRLVCGIDLDWEGLKKHPAIRNRVHGDLTRLPFLSATFNVVSANMVAEHLEDPVAVLREVHRVLAPGGTFIFHTPNAKGWFVRMARLVPEAAKKPLVKLLEGRNAEDVFPTHYRLNRAETIERAAAESGLNTAQVSYVSSSAVTAMLGPFVAGELLMLRVLRRPALASWRSNLVVQLRKPRPA
jgi:SAM-dependent methyltransferase